jgi:hypothetical protein
MQRIDTRRKLKARFFNVTTTPKMIRKIEIKRAVCGLAVNEKTEDMIARNANMNLAYFTSL